MNMSRVISALKMEFGLNRITLPFQDENGHPIPAEKTIKEVLETITIPEYSEFVPWMREGSMHLRDMRRIDPHLPIYKLPPHLCITPIKYVVSVTTPFNHTRGVFGDVAPEYGMNCTTQGVAMGQAHMMVVNQMRNEPTFDYIGENKIKLYGYPSTILTFTVAAEHAPSGETIEDTCYDSFMELARLDLKVFLYQNLKLYDGIPSAFGNVQLKIDDYQSASQDRDALLEKWRDSYHVDIPWWEFM